MRSYGRYICCPCWSARQRRYEEARRARNPDLLSKRRQQVKERQAGWSEDRKFKERRRRYNAWLQREYGITIEEYDRMLAAQNNRCAICETDAPAGRGSFHVDHDHDTGAVRKLLCTSCNMMLGLVNDDDDRLMRAAQYLRDHKPGARMMAGGKAY